ncbi:hypothetical protein VJY32_12665 [Ignavibacteria bacterium 4148-Me]
MEIKVCVTVIFFYGYKFLDVKAAAILFYKLILYQSYYVYFYVVLIW